MVPDAKRTGHPLLTHPNTQAPSCSPLSRATCMALALMCFHQRPNAVERYCCAVRLKVNPTMGIITQLTKLCDQDAYLELKPQSKMPITNDWPNQGNPFDEVITPDGNLGLILGATNP